MNISTCFGPNLHGEYEGTAWCNAHLHTFVPGVPNKHDIVVDPSHPMYGTLATLRYPSDSYPFVVVGGSKSGKTLHFAPINIPGNWSDVTRAQALDHANLPASRTLRQSAKNPNRYGDNMFLGHAHRYLAPEL